MPGTPDEVPAAYYDGSSSRRRAVYLSVANGRFRLHGEGVEREGLLETLRVSERLGSAPRVITFDDGTHCEVSDLAGLGSLLEVGGYRESCVVRWQFSTRAMLLSLFALVLLILAGHEWFVPWMARQAAEQAPQALVSKLSTDTLKTLDETVLKPSLLPAFRQAALARRFSALQPPDAGLVAIRLEFRSGGALGANAFALPSGIILVTDELIALAGSDEEILGVLAHELGHVQARHGLRLMLEGSIVGLVTAWYIGDVSTVLAGLPAALSRARYSRAFETEADDFAARMLRGNGIAPARLADMLERMEVSHVGKPVGDDRSGASSVDYFSSHPLSIERIRRLRGG
jgi:Zn-dependent protease with chaperone function